MSNNHEDSIHGGSASSKIIKYFSYLILFAAIVLLILGKWVYTVIGIVLHFTMSYIAYRLADGRRNPVIWRRHVGSNLYFEHNLLGGMWGQISKLDKCYK